jgi:circadian clock protein KaiC
LFASSDKVFKENRLGFFMKRKGKVSKVVRKASKPVKKVSAKDKYKQEYLKLGINGFDKLSKQGIPEGSAVIVEGSPGSGKTIFCLNILKNMCERKKKVLFMSFEEPEDRLRSHLTTFGADVDRYEKEGNLMIKRFNALDISRSVEALLSEAKKELLIDVQPVLIPIDFKPDIVLIDSLTSIGSAFTGESNRFRTYMEQLFRYLEGHDITSFLIRETVTPGHTGNGRGGQGDAVSFLSDGIIVMYNVFYRDGGHRKRAVEILKMRGAEIERKIVEFDIKAGKGFVVSSKNLTGKYTLT